jgi:hypothetical protein
MDGLFTTPALLFGTEIIDLKSERKALTFNSWKPDARGNLSRRSLGEGGTCRAVALAKAEPVAP